MFNIECPKCGQKHTLKISNEDLEYARTYSIFRVGYIHSDHVLILDIDSNGTIRGAYLRPLRGMSSGIKYIYGDYEILTSPIVESKSNLIIVYLANKKVDMRAGIRFVSKIPNIIRGILDITKRISKYKWYRSTVSLGGTDFDIAFRDNILVLLRSEISNWLKKTNVLRKILDTISRVGTLGIEHLRELVDSIDKQ